MTGFTKNFVVKNGLTTGNITLDADSGNISGTNLSVTGVSNLGAIANVIITGGSSGQAIVTDGAGNLSFANASGASTPAPMPIIIDAGNTLTISANYQGLFGYPLTIDGVLDVEGILIDVNDASSGGTATALNANIANVSISGGTSGYYLQTDGAGTLSWAAGGGGGSGSPGGVTTQVQFNDAGSFAGNTGFTFNKTTGIFTAPYLAGNGNGLSNIQGANISGAVSYATTSNSVAGANVSGTVSSATTAGTVTTAAQPNITSTGTLTSATVSGNVSANNLSTSNLITAGNGLQVTTGTLTLLSGNLDITGNINVTGNLNYSNVTDLVVGDPLIYIGANNTGDTVDLGIVGSYNNGTYYHTGLARNASNDYWTFYDGVVAEPTTVIDWANATYPTVKLGNIVATGTVSATGNGTFGNIASDSFNLVTITQPAVTATLTLANGSSLITSGAYSTTLTSTATTNATLPAGTNKLGYLNVPQSGGADKTTSYTLATTDVGQFISIGTGGSIVIPDSVFSTGDAISIYNNTSANATITCSIANAYISGTDSVKASVTLATRGVTTVLFISSSVCVLAGSVS